MAELTITNVANDMTDEAHLSKICNKDVFLNGEINNGATISVIRYWTSKKYSWTPNFKNQLIKCSPRTRKHIVKVNDGYIGVELSRCKSFDHFFAPQCFHCYKFNHFPSKYPDKDIPFTCGKCAERDKTENQNRNSQEKFVIFLQNRERNLKHNAFSHECLTLKEKKN